MTEDLHSLVVELEDAATRLRAGDLDGDEAAELVERCAQLAARVGSELDRAARDADRAGPGDGQERLL